MCCCLGGVLLVEIRSLDLFVGLVGLIGDVLVGVCVCVCCGWVCCWWGWVDVLQRVGGLIELGSGVAGVWAMGLLLWDVWEWRWWWRWWWGVVC